MACPYSSNFKLVCFRKIGTYLKGYLDLCHGEHYGKCPLFKIIAEDEFCCEYFREFPDDGRFHTDNINEFIEITEKYCLSKKGHAQCKRYLKRKNGASPNWLLMPDGTEKTPPE